MKGKAAFTILVLLLLSVVSNAQPGTNKAKLQELHDRFEARYNANRSEAILFASTRGIKMRDVLPDGTVIELQFIDNGRPVYYETQNLGAAVSVRTNELWSGGSTGLNLDGTGYNGLGIWDDGGVRTSHQEFTNNGPSRITQKDNPPSLSDHSTHVAGTLIAHGIVAEAKGMANNANLQAWDWNGDESEMTAAALAGLEISNHSYSVAHGWSNGYWAGDASINVDEDYWFGLYTESTKAWDDIAYNAPYYLIVKSAGNDRDDIGDGSFPPDGNQGTGYDCIGTKATAKNILTVGAVEDVISYTGPSSVVMSSFSSWGPVDDGRIKPDIVANGVNLYSTLSRTDKKYGFDTGTSMAAPNAAGTMALLQEHYKNTHGGASMRAATLKALVIHTADETGPDVGPDYMFGWGLLNAVQAAAKITEDDDIDFNVIDELSLSNGQVFTRDITIDGSVPLIVTIAWTDPAGTPIDGELDPIDPMLVNDLDLSITLNSTTYFPWKLNRNNPELPATNDTENNVDNVETVFIANPDPGTYTINVSHKGVLTDPQYYSIIISGITKPVPPFAPIAEFSGTPLIIDAGQSVLFTDLSTNNPTSWDWVISDGTNILQSSQQNPEIIFSSAGVYDVTLVATNDSGSDDELKTGYITVNQVGANYCDSHGDATAEWIAGIDFAGKQNSVITSGVSGYQDFTTFIFDVESNSSNPITLTPGFNPRSKFENWAVWIDFNNNQTFDDPGERVFTAIKNKLAVSGNISIPEMPEMVTRMRVSMSRDGIPGPCDIYSYGEVEDYTISIGGSTPTVMVADFMADATNIAIGDEVQFTDQTTNQPDNWDWTISDGTTTFSATDQNPLITFDTPGVYDVTLLASSATESDMEIKPAFITVTSTPTIYCTSMGLGTDMEWIASLSIGNDFINETPTSSGYTYFDASPIDLNEGETYEVLMSPGFSGKVQREYWRIWIDYNGDKDFLDPGEEVLAVNNARSNVSGSITIPTITSKNTRMRISMSRGSAPSACVDIDNGEVQDYLVNLIAAPVNGSNSKSGIASSINEITPSDLIIYPNPSDNWIQISYSGDLNAGNLTVYNIQGAVLINKRVSSNNTSLDIRQLSPGIYYLALNTGERMIYRKIIKQ